MYPEARVYTRNPAVGLCEAISHANPSTSPVQNSTLSCQRPLVCLQPPIAYRPWYTSRLSRDLQILPPLPQPAGWTSQCPGCYPVYAPQHCPAAKAPMAIWSSYCDRRLTWAYGPVRPVGVSSMDDYSLLLSLTSHLLIASLGVDCKFAVLNKKNLRKSVAPWRWLQYVAETCRSEKLLCTVVGNKTVCGKQLHGICVTLKFRPLISRIVFCSDHITLALEWRASW